MSICYFFLCGGLDYSPSFPCSGGERFGSFAAKSNWGFSVGYSIWEKSSDPIYGDKIRKTNPEELLEGLFKPNGDEEGEAKEFARGGLAWVGRRVGNEGQGVDTAG